MDDSQIPKLSIIVPSFGCAGSISELIQRLFALDRFLGSIEVIVVDDESRDGSWQIVSELAKVRQNLTALRLPRNRGQNYAVALGISRSVGRFIATIDCDLEFEPETIVPMLKELGDSADCVVASSTSVRDNRLTRRLLRGLYHRLMASITGSSVLSSETVAYSFLVANGEALRKVVRVFPLSDPISTKLISSDMQIATYQTVRMSRQAGFSSYTMSENLHVVSRSILSSGRGGEIFAIRLTGFLTAGSLLVGIIWLTLGFFEGTSGFRDVAFLLMLFMFTVLTISSVLVFALHIMTSVLSEVRSLKAGDANLNSQSLDSGRK